MQTSLVGVVMVCVCVCVCVCVRVCVTVRNSPNMASHLSRQSQITVLAKGIADVVFFLPTFSVFGGVRAEYAAPWDADHLRRVCAELLQVRQRQLGVHPVSQGGSDDRGHRLHQAGGLHAAVKKSACARTPASLSRRSEHVPLMLSILPCLP